MNSICKFAALKVPRKQRYRILKIRKFNAYKNDWDYNKIPPGFYM